MPQQAQCPRCGTLQPLDAAFCPSCGVKFRSVAGSVAAPQAPAAVAPPPTAPPSGTARSAAPQQRRIGPGGYDLAKVATGLRNLNYCILALLGLAVGVVALPAAQAPPAALLLILVAAFGLGLVCIWTVGQLSSSLRMPFVLTLVYCVCMFISCLNLLVLLLLSHQATNVLKKAGVRVGLLGANPAEAALAMSGHHCWKCRYDLTGNTTGMCPECGSTQAR